METISYFSVDYLDRSKCEKLHYQYKLGKYLDKGATAKIYEACRDNQDCNYILKVIEYDSSIFNLTGEKSHSVDSKYEHWKKEVEMHQLIEKCQKTFYYEFTPHLYDAWYCFPSLESNKVYFYMLIEKYEGNLMDFINKYSRQGVSKLLKTTIKMLFRELNSALFHVHNTCNICINDIKLENILYKENKDTYSFVFADFGISHKELIYNPGAECKRIDKERLKQLTSTFLRNLNIED